MFRLMTFFFTVICIVAVTVFLVCLMILFGPRSNSLPRNANTDQVFVQLGIQAQLAVNASYGLLISGIVAIFSAVVAFGSYLSFVSAERHDEIMARRATYDVHSRYDDPLSVTGYQEKKRARNRDF